MRIRTTLLLALAAACTFQPGQTPPTSTPSPTSSPAHTPTRAPSPTPTRIPSPTTPPCLEAPGEIRTGEIDDPALFRPLPYRVYLPRCYDEGSETGFPVIYLLHGLQATDAQWDDLGVDETAARLIAEGEIPPLILVMPWERRGLDYEAAIADVLVPWVDATFRTLDTAQGRAIGGLSRGAGWALRIALQNPGLFSALGLHSPAVLTPDLYYIPVWAEAMTPRQIPRLWVDIGERDPLRSPALELTAALESAGLEYEWHLNPGTHDAAYWSSHLEEYLRWYADEWQ